MTDNARTHIRARGLHDGDAVSCSRDASCPKKEMEEKYAREETDARVLETIAFLDPAKMRLTEQRDLRDETYGEDGGGRERGGRGGGLIAPRRGLVRLCYRWTAAFQPQNAKGELSFFFSKKMRERSETARRFRSALVAEREARSIAMASPSRQAGRQKINRV